jgi:4'-phosphopantetheinyl transferase
VWQVNIDLRAPPRFTPDCVLSKDEIARGQSFKGVADANRFLATRTALRLLLSVSMNLHPKVVRLTQDTHGKLVLADAKGVDFSVSHSGSQALIAISTNGPVGIDIEERCMDFNWVTVASHLLTACESRYIDTLPSALACNVFYDTWVAKEAFLKALGVGITYPLTAFSVLAEHLPPSAHVDCHRSKMQFLPSTNADDKKGVVVPNIHEPGELTQLSTFRGDWLLVVEGYSAFIAWSTKAQEGAQ